MNMEEKNPAGDFRPETEPAEELEELTADQIIDILRAYKAEGVDFEEEDEEHVRAMEGADETLEYAIIALESAGLDAETILRERRVGIIEENPPEAVALQQRPPGPDGRTFTTEEHNRIMHEAEGRDSQESA